MQAPVRAEALTKTYRVGFWGRRVRAVQDLSFEVRAGEIFGLLGPNGAGKTTTLKMLLGFVKPSSGHAWISGNRVGTVASRRSLGYLPENPALYEFLRGDEYLIFAGRLAGLSRTEVELGVDTGAFEVEIAAKAGVPCAQIGKVHLHSSTLDITLPKRSFRSSVANLRRAYHQTIPSIMARTPRAFHWQWYIRIRTAWARSAYRYIWPSATRW